MLPRSLTGRIVLAFAGLATAMLLAVAATLFLVLHELHENEIKDSLSRQVVLVVVTLAGEPAGQWDATLADTGASIADDGGYILVQNPNGAIRVLAGSPSSLQMPPGPTGSAKTAIGTTKTSDGKPFIYIEPSKDATRGRTIVFAVPDRSVQLALGDLSRALLIVVLVLLVVGIPVAWLLSRSLTGPMRRLAGAAAELPAASGETQPLPLEGPTEVKVLTERFNAMAHELASTRQEETQLLANLRHDLRTPLTSIGGFAEAIADGTASGDRATAAARTIAEEAQRLERLVGELGVVERLRQGPAALRPEALDATALLTEAAARFESRAAGLGLAIEVAGAIRGEPALAFTGDRLAVERILQNLVENALSVVPRGGHVWLRAAPLRMSGRPPGISLSVTDDGPGFPPGTSERVFERFFRADLSRTGGGSGLGLAIVRELARAHGGEAWAENVAPHGARVTVLLPLSPAIGGVAESGEDSPEAGA
ncbi:MAG: HAMP domain-containing sensor histidine kinase [Candidatus Limnocylindrales bacterium]|jgi:signal transduction histidine kinase